MLDVVLDEPLLIKFDDVVFEGAVVSLVVVVVSVVGEPPPPPPPLPQADIKTTKINIAKNIFFILYIFS